MKERPLLYDVFCGAGGCTKGYQQAGFYVVGIDNEPQPHYCGDDFIQMDAFTFLEALYNKKYPAPMLISASPPCQGYTKLRFIHGKEYPRLIALTRAALQTIKKPYIIENVYDARRELINPIKLCGTMFGLRVQRHRVFECHPVLWFPPRACQHIGKTNSVNGRDESGKRILGTLDNYQYLTIVGKGFKVADAQIAMDIDWMVGKELAQAIPPAYTRWIGEQMLKLLTG